MKKKQKSSLTPTMSRKHELSVAWCVYVAEHTHVQTRESKLLFEKLCDGNKQILLKGKWPKKLKY